MDCGLKTMDYYNIEPQLNTIRYVFHNDVINPILIWRTH